MAANAIVWLACVLVFLVAAAASAHRRPTQRATPRLKKSRSVRPRRTPRKVVSAEAAHESVEEHVHVRRGDTFESILAARGIGSAEAGPWFEAAATAFDLRHVRPRRGVTLRFDRETRALEAIRYEIDDRALLVVEETDAGITAYQTALPYVIEVKGVAGRIERGLREDAAEAGVPPRVISELADAVGWDVNVDGGLEPGDEFRVLYENIWQLGLERAEPGKLMGASIVSRGLPLTAVYFEDAEGRGAFYRPGGRPLSRTFLRYPVDFTEISSEFSLLRFHPILRRERPHLGVDFAAPLGTPVRAAANGEVVLSARLPELGRCIRVLHADGATSVYGHLSRFAPGITEGLFVERGQVIGYVGATGLATGPHLHYALFRDGEYVDPLAMLPAEEEPVTPDERHRFERIAGEVVHHLEGLPATSTVHTITLSRNTTAGSNSGGD